MQRRPPDGWRLTAGGWMLGAAALLLAAAPALAQVRSSANYAIAADEFDSGGGASTSANYEQRISFGQSFEMPPMVGVNYSSGGGLEPALPAADTQAPTVPAGLAATAMSVSQIELNWTAASDNVAVTAYRVFRGGAFRATVNAPTTSFSDTGLAAATNYSYTVAACDAAGNCSAQSSTASATTAALGSIPQSGLRVWLKADAGVAVAPSTSSVTQWLDQSGNGVDVVQGTAAKRPVVVTSTPNGLPALRFDGVDDYLQTAAPVTLLSGNSATVFVALRPGATQTLYADILDYTHATAINFVVQQNGSITNQYIFNDGTLTQFSPAHFQVYMSSFTSAGAALARVNGVAVSSGTTPFQTFSQPNYFTVGNKSLEAIARQWNGDVAEVILYDRVLTNGESSTVEAYLLARYGLDTSPDAFSLGARAGVAPGSQQLSDPVTVAGINTAAPIAVSGGQYSIDGAAFTSAPGLVAAGQLVQVRLTASGASGTLATATLSIGGASATFNVTTSGTDTQAPTVPTGLNATAVSSSQINLAWTASTDNVTVTAYQVFRGGAFQATVNAPATAYSDTGLTPSTLYAYTVAACDASGNCSIPSASASATTAAIGFTFTPNLAANWNLMGNALDITLDVAATFGGNSNVASVWKWDAANQGWAYYAPSLSAQQLIDFTNGRGYQVLASIGPGEGYWVNALAPITLPVQSGAAFTYNSASFAALPSNWNFIATASNQSPHDFANAVSGMAAPPAGVNAPFLSLWAWDAQTQTWYYYAPALENTQCGASPCGLPAVQSYAGSRGYLHFEDTGKTLGIGTGFWVNRP